jgi:DNA-binding IscR family transcriptional regulator
MPTFRVGIYVYLKQKNGLRPSGHRRLTDVIGAVGDEVALVACQKHGHLACDQMGCCTVRGPLVRVQEKLLDYLGQIKLDELYRPEEALPVERINL